MEKYIELECEHYNLLLERDNTFIKYENGTLMLTLKQLKKIIEQASMIEYQQRYGVPV